MKRSPMPARRTPLRASKPLNPSRRPLARRTRLTPVSAKRRAVGVTRARPDEPLADWCELRIPDLCWGRATDRHHILPRGAGGGDEATNTLDLCNPCHIQGVHGRQAWARANGYLRSRYVG